MVNPPSAVCIHEQEELPDSVVENATAVPARVGDTIGAFDKGDSVRDRPWRLNAMTDSNAFSGKD
ncbi:hypothetical protein [Massilia sp. H6]|uniref:hypothetical protein n=1 Tax=Massilia sp. H6 TaxID=2970464 RepID=UPI0021688B2F|nr:hypothetical protein [Massilia sp. H6]UVW27243.1 hypothetical protein NRS07_11770 [Massilia sp. H6]